MDVEVAGALAGVVAVSVEEAMPSVCLELGAGRNDTHVAMSALWQGAADAAADADVGEEGVEEAILVEGVRCGGC